MTLHLDKLVSSMDPYKWVYLFVNLTLWLHHEDFLSVLHAHIQNILVVWHQSKLDSGPPIASVSYVKGVQWVAAECNGTGYGPFRRILFAVPLEEGCHWSVGLQICVVYHSVFAHCCTSHAICLCDRDIMILTQWFSYCKGKLVWCVPAPLAYYSPHQNQFVRFQIARRWLHFELCHYTFLQLSLWQIILSNPGEFP